VHCYIYSLKLRTNGKSFYLPYEVSVDRRETTTGMNPVAEKTVAYYLI
jgi:hypothetical protein